MEAAHMTKETLATKKQIRLIKWRFLPGKVGHGGAVQYWWSDGSKAEEKVASYVEAVDRLKIIHDDGGIRHRDN